MIFDPISTLIFGLISTLGTVLIIMARVAALAEPTIPPEFTGWGFNLSNLFLGMMLTFGLTALYLSVLTLATA